MPDELLSPRVLAAKLLAADDLTDAEIAAKCGVSRSTITRWKSDQDFRGSIKQLRDAMRRGAEEACRAWRSML
jgi:transposase